MSDQETRQATESRRRIQAVAAAFAAGRPREALDLAEAALAARVQSPLILQLVASARQRIGRHEEAHSLFERAVSLAPDDPGGWVALAGCLFAARRPDMALQVCDRGLARLPGRPALLCAKARVLQSLSRTLEAADLYRQALAADDTNAEARFGLALQATEAGDWDGAEAMAAPLLARTPAWPDLDWLAARIALGRGDFQAAYDRVGKLLAVQGLPPEQRAEATLLLGEALDGLGRPAEAFAAFGAGKRALRTFYAERAAGREGETDKLKRLGGWFRAADPAPWQTSPPLAATPGGPRGHVFLVGFPRSGTTLLEQALAGNPEVAALEEAPTLAGAYAEFMTSAEGLERLARLTPAEAETWRAAYWAEVARGGIEVSGRIFLDKAPAGTLYLPLIAKLFPGAKILFALRDPRDVVLSCLRSSFQMNAMTYTFTDLGEAARCYVACMDMAEAYRAVLPLDMVEVRHEALVDNFPEELGKIAGFLRLELMPAMSDVAATARRRVVRTPSAGQVRAGLNRKGVGRWRDYAVELEPVMAILAPWTQRFGYETTGGGEG